MTKCEAGPLFSWLGFAVLLMAAAEDYKDPFAGLSLIPGSVAGIRNSEPLRAPSAPVMAPVAQHPRASFSARDPFDPIPSSVYNLSASSLASSATSPFTEDLWGSPEDDWNLSSATPPPAYQQVLSDVELPRPLPPPLPPHAPPPPPHLAPSLDVALAALDVGPLPPGQSLEQVLLEALAMERAEFAALEQRLRDSGVSLVARVRRTGTLQPPSLTAVVRPAWPCSTCTLVNDDDLGRCGACGERRPTVSYIVDAVEAESSRGAEAVATSELAPLLVRPRSTTVDGSRDCIVCMDAERNAVLVHEGDAHHVVCMGCAEMLKLAGKPCPVCQRPIEDVLRYFS